jgi:hypothetical protein
VLTAACLVVGCGGGDPDGAGDDLWVPQRGTEWQWQLSELPIDTSVDVPVYDVDLFTTSPAEVAELHAAGRHVVCYVSVGTWEPGRPDSDRFPGEVLGEHLDDFPDERWLDIRRLDVLEPIISDRFDRCADAGFDAIEPDNVDGYANDSGFDLDETDQLEFNRRIAALAHERGLSVGLKNDLEQIPDLVGDFDWALNEECVAFDECDAYRPFIDARKPVLHVEYDVPLLELCRVTGAIGGFSSMRKHIDLGVDREPCP